MQVVMVMFRADGERRSFSLTRDLTVIGRREDCDLRIPLGDVSRKHCRIVRNGDMVSLEDLGSSNGTFVNGQRITEAVLNAGDTIQVGPVLFCVQIDGVPAEEDMAPIFTSPQEPAYAEEPAEPMEDAVAVEGSQVGYEALETLPEEEEAVVEVEAELDDFEAVEADDVQPAAAGAPAGEEPALESLESLEEAEAAVAEPGVEPVAEGEEAFIDDEAAAQADLIAQPLEDEQPVEGEADHVSLDEFEVIEEPAEEGDESGEAQADRNRH